MNNIVKFNDIDISLINHDNEKYIALSQIVTALETTHNHIAQIYSRHKEEFTEEMSKLIKKGRTRVRIFNREGAWLIGMFARTPKAVEFRKWVLKVLGAVADNIPQTNKAVTVSEHTRAYPSPKKEIVLSDKAKSEIGGIVKAVLQAQLNEISEPNLFMQTIPSRETIKDLLREVIHEEISAHMLKDGVKKTELFNGNVTADGLPVANWIVGIIHGANALNCCINQLKEKQEQAVKLLGNN